MIKAIIIEDEQSSMEYLSSILKKNHPVIKIIGWASNVDDSVAMIKKKQPDIVFLDIQLKDGSGFEVLDKLQTDMTFEVIFTTGFLDYKEKAMDYFAFYYLNKPVQESELKRVLDMYILKRSAFDKRKYEAFKNQMESRHEAITIFDKGEYTSLRHAYIIYCEAYGNYTKIYLKNNQMLTLSKSLKYFESLLEHGNFLRVHRTYLVNMPHIKDISTNGILTLSNNKEIAISIRNRKKAMDALKLYNSKVY
jgi:two-component system LytT family response regulator